MCIRDRFKENNVKKRLSWQHDRGNAVGSLTSRREEYSNPVCCCVCNCFVMRYGTAAFEFFRQRDQKLQAKEPGLHVPISIKQAYQPHNMQEITTINSTDSP
eukprot:3731527-Amphidinium_carterae.1